MANLNLPSGEHEQQRPEDLWAEKISQWTHRNIAFDGGTAFEFGRDYFKFKDKFGNQITVKISSK